MDQRLEEIFKEMIVPRMISPLPEPRQPSPSPEPRQPSPSPEPRQPSPLPEPARRRIDLRPAVPGRQQVYAYTVNGRTPPQILRGLTARKRRLLEKRLFCGKPSDKLTRQRLWRMKPGSYRLTGYVARSSRVVVSEPASRKFIVVQLPTAFHNRCDDEEEMGLNHITGRKDFVLKIGEKGGKAELLCG